MGLEYQIVQTQIIPNLFRIIHLEFCRTMSNCCNYLYSSTQTWLDMEWHGSKDDSSTTHRWWTPPSPTLSHHFSPPDDQGTGWPCPDLASQDEPRWWSSHAQYALAVDARYGHGSPVSNTQNGWWSSEHDQNMKWVVWYLILVPTWLEILWWLRMKSMVEVISLELVIPFVIKKNGNKKSTPNMQMIRILSQPLIQILQEGLRQRRWQMLCHL